MTSSAPSTDYGNGTTTPVIDDGDSSSMTIILSTSIISGVIVVAGIVIAGVFIFLRKRKQTRKKLKIIKSRHRETIKLPGIYVMPTRLNQSVNSLPDLVEQFNDESDFIELSDYQQLNINLTISDVKIGEGHFGEIYVGTLQLPGRDNEKVAVKRVKSLHPQSVAKAMKEAAIMHALDHPNVLKIVGIAVIDQRLNIVLPFMGNGNLRDFLRSEMAKQTISQDQMLQFCVQISSGMAYLAEKRVIYRDLACRNILIDENLLLKIADFGLARNLDEKDDLAVIGRRRLPIVWHPPESLRGLPFDEKSDVWSLGVVMWEIFSWADRPYLLMSNAEIVKFVLDGGRLACPKNCSGKLFAGVISNCWNEDPNARPSFKEILDLLNAIDA